MATYADGLNSYNKKFMANAIKNFLAQNPDTIARDFKSDDIKSFAASLFASGPQKPRKTTNRNSEKSSIYWGFVHDFRTQNDANPDGIKGYTNILSAAAKIWKENGKGQNLSEEEIQKYKAAYADSKKAKQEKILDGQKAKQEKKIAKQKAKQEKELEKELAKLEKKLAKQKAKLNKPENPEASETSAIPDLSDVAEESDVVVSDSDMSGSESE